MVLVQNYRHIEMQPSIFINYIDILVNEECKTKVRCAYTPLGNDLLIDKLLIWLTDMQIYFIFISGETNNGEILNFLIKDCYHYIFVSI